MAGRRTQQKFFDFLQHCEHNGKTFSKQDLLEAAGWKTTTFDTYFNKGQISQFVSEVGNGEYQAVNTIDLTLVEFTKRLSQSKHFQELGHKCKSRLAKALLKKSRDNMMLALELYNRPSLENKLDGFVLLFCTAWEQLTKSMLIESDGENSIFLPSRNKGFRETISLRQSLARLFNDADHIRRNVEIVTEWRDQAAHLLMPELQAIASRIFQSGVLNYASEFEKFAGVPFISSQHTGMMTLVGDFKLPAMSVLQTQYGSAAQEILDLAVGIQKSIEATNDISFAIPLKVHLVFAKEEGDAQVILTKASGNVQDLNALKQKLTIVEKPVEPDKSHPYGEKQLIRLVNKTLHEKYSIEKIERCLPYRNPKSGMPELNAHCIQSCMVRLGWKKTNNEFHYYGKLANRHQYSDLAIRELVKRITQEDGFVVLSKQKMEKQKSIK